MVVPCTAVVDRPGSKTSHLGRFLGMRREPYSGEDHYSECPRPKDPQRPTKGTWLILIHAFVALIAAVPTVAALFTCEIPTVVMAAGKARADPRA